MSKTWILVVCDDLWHPAEIIERGLNALPQDKYDFEIVKTAKDILTPEYLNNYPAVICCKGNCVNQGNSEPWFEAGVTEVMPEDFDRYIQAGHGFLALHSGLTYSQRSRPDFAAITGCDFRGHPPRCQVNFSVTDAAHPIAADVDNFTSRDEHYLVDVTAPDAQVFFTSQSEKGGVQPAGYTRLMGKGRLCALTQGHTLAGWMHPQFQRLLLGAIAWCLQEAETT